MFPSHFRRGCIALATGLAVLVSSCNSLPVWPDSDGGDDCPGQQARTCDKPTVMALAHDLDDLEAHIERFGSVVAKQPDIWGQARMTKHRDEFEKQMAVNVGLFKPTLQGSLQRSDQAFFADALALSAAISGPQAALLPPAPVTVDTIATTQKTDTTKGPTTGSTQKQSTTQPAPPVKVPDLPTSPDISGFGNSDVIVRSTTTSPAGIGFGDLGKAGISLEPTEQLSQEARYLNYLQHLRRINEGDDTADSPGYSLNLVRVPVSVLPGKCTETGYGAEITFTATPELSAELLPMTFRNLVVNDLLDQLGLPLTQVLNDKALVQAYLKDEATAEVVLCALRCECEAEGLLPRRDLNCAAMLPATEKGTAPDTAGIRALAAANPVKFCGAVKKEIRSRITIPSIPATKGRRALLPFPPSQMFEVYGFEPVFNIAHEAYRAFQRDPANRQFVHYPDVQGYLQEELNAAYKFLADPHNHALWEFCNPDLVTAIRAHQDEAVRSMRCHFLVAVQELTRPAPGTPECVPLPDVAHSATAAFAWAIVVESALLTDQLVADMKQTAVAKGCACPHEGWLPYYLPDPPGEARQAFNEYVRCRWPIHVFALDPEVEEQNIADAFTLRREMQLSLSLAFASGQISGRNMMRFARRIEQDYETIALNRTAVGFSHGDDTFGWRFYPRFQTPDIESNLTVFFRDLLIGGPNRRAVLRQRQLEPGPRECVAIIIMPSFVPYVTFDSSANWFRLTNPKRKELNAAQAMRLSREVRSLKECGPRVQDGDCYRCGDVPLLLRKADQLSSRLPFQSQLVQVPYENTLGGFAMFNTGVTDLAPQLRGWYGAEGIDPTRDNTLFLVGDHFSVLSTRVVAGGREIVAANQELLSRQVIKATVPAGAQVLHDKDGDFVDVHVATPYGVTQHLLIPAYPPPRAATPAPPAAGFSLDGTDLTVSYCWQRVQPDKGLAFWRMQLTSAAPALKLTWTDATAKSLPFAKVVFQFPQFKAEQLLKADPPAAGSDYPIDTALLGARALDVVNDPPGNYDPNRPPDGVALATTAIQVTPLDDPTKPEQGHAVKTVAAGNNLTVHFKADPEAAKRLCCPPLPCPPVPPMPKADPAAAALPELK